jgi:hypothetical protein
MDENFLPFGGDAALAAEGYYSPKIKDSYFPSLFLLFSAIVFIFVSY